jgi:hypothetical protein
VTYRTNVVEEPSYGFTVETLADRIIVTIPKRHSRELKMLSIVMAVAAAPMILTGLAGHVFGGISLFLGLCLVGIIVIAQCWDKVIGEYQRKTIQIDKSYLTINKKTYRREHISSWSTRWKEGDAIIGPAVTVALASAMLDRMPNQTYKVTFDYGEQRLSLSTA